MSQPSRATTVQRSRSMEKSSLVFLCLAAWAIPGSGHLWLGRRSKGSVFLVAVTLMFVIGLVLEGRIFPFEFAQPLVGLAAVADLGAGLTYVIARVVGLGAGLTTAATFDYGNSFLIGAGLLNFLIILDAYDVALGRK